MRYWIMMLAAGLWIAAGISGAAAALEKSAALDGSQYAVIPQLFDGSTGSLSFIRLFNGGNVNTTFNLTVINAADGSALGSATIQVPRNAAPQFPLTPAGGGNSILTQAGITASSGAAYALYIKNTDALAGYEHVTYNGASTLFENNSVCATPMNQQLASINRQVLTNVHTSALASNAYPSVLGLHNYSTAPVVVILAASDAATGTSIGQVTQSVAANATVTLTENQLETQLNFHPAPGQPHINLFVTSVTGGALPVSVTQSIRNVALGGEINMAEACAVNAVAPAVAAVAPASYCGTFRIPISSSPYNLINHTFMASVSPTGKLRGVYYGIDTTNQIQGGDVVTGTVTGTTLAGSTANGPTVSGTLQNGVMIATFTNVLGSFSVTATANACN